MKDSRGVIRKNNGTPAVTTGRSLNFVGDHQCINLKRAYNEIDEWFLELKRRIVDNLGGLDHCSPGTLEFAIGSALRAGFEPRELSAWLGSSQTTIGRWAKGQTIPRSAPYRKFLVEAIIRHLMDGHDILTDQTKLFDNTIRPIGRRPHRSPRATDEPIT